MIIVMSPTGEVELIEWSSNYGSGPIRYQVESAFYRRSSYYPCQLSHTDKEENDVSQALKKKFLDQRSIVDKAKNETKRNEVKLVLDKLSKNELWKRNVPERFQKLNFGRNSASLKNVERVNNNYSYIDGEIIYFDYCGLFGKIISSSPKDHFSKDKDLYYANDKLFLPIIDDVNETNIFQKYDECENNLQLAKKNRGRISFVGYSNRKLMRTDLKSVFTDNSFAINKTIDVDENKITEEKLEKKEEKKAVKVGNKFKLIKLSDLQKHLEFQLPYRLTYCQEVDTRACTDKYLDKEIDKILLMFDNDYEKLSPKMPDDQEVTMIVIPRKQKNDSSIVRFSFVFVKSNLLTGEVAEVEKLCTSPLFTISPDLKKLILENAVEKISQGKLWRANLQHSIEERKNKYESESYDDNYGRRQSYYPSLEDFDFQFIYQRGQHGQDGQDKEQMDRIKQRRDEMAQNEYNRKMKEKQELEYYTQIKQRAKDAARKIIEQIIL
jgi:hypothetical protein